ncbi:hypothetical protein D9M68_593540 [compost metagenome]
MRCFFKIIHFEIYLPYPTIGQGLCGRMLVGKDLCAFKIFQGFRKHFFFEVNITQRTVNADQPGFIIIFFEYRQAFECIFQGRIIISHIQVKIGNISEVDRLIDHIIQVFVDLQRFFKMHQCIGNIAQLAVNAPVIIQGFCL